MKVLLSTVLLLLATVATALPSGAGNCVGGRAAVGVTHLQGDVTEGSLEDGGLRMSIGSQVLQVGQITELPVGADLPWMLNATARPMRGFLIRGEDRSDDAPSDTTEAFSSKDQRSQVAETVCINTFNVGGVTHTNNNQKRFVRGSFRMDEPVREIQLDVTVVMKNRNGESVFYYSGFVVSMIDKAQPEIPGSLIAVDDADNDEDEDYLFDTLDGLPLMLRSSSCSDEFPCEECWGDCNKNSHCADGLECFFRPDTTRIPGCLGAGAAGTDYCYKPRNDTLHLRSVDCSADRPCDDCQGSCMTDADCDKGLSCFVRPDSTPVPSCEGKGISGRNYCFELPKTTEPIPTLKAVECNRTQPCALCEGECQRHSDCEGDLQCFFRPDLTPVPGCSSSFLGVPGRNYCSEPQASTLMLRETPCSTFMPCNECEGECSHYSQCKGTMECWRRSDMEEVPGCAGGGISGNDYCYDPDKEDMLVTTATEPPVQLTPMPTPLRPTDRPTKAPSTPRPTRRPVALTPQPTPPRPTVEPSPRPTPRPRPTPEPTPRPTRRPRPTLDVVAEEEFEVATEPPITPRPTNRRQPTPMPVPPRPTLRPNTPENTPRPTRRPRPTLSPTPKPTNLNGGSKALRERATPCEPGNRCGECQGDCQSDDDCRGDLECFQRPDDTRVPGCSGLGVTGTDYCAVNPNAGSTPRPTTPPRPTPNKRPPTPNPTPQQAKKKPTMQPYVDDNNEEEQERETPLRDKNGGDCSDNAKCGKCVGDCDSDDQCAGVLRCYFRSGFQRVPGCSGTGTFGKDYCTFDPSVGIGSPLGNNQVTPTNNQVNTGRNNNKLLVTRSRVCTADDPCGECQGDCDSNRECAGTMQCFFRVGREKVPGCNGAGVQARDYCAVNPNTARVRRRDLEESEVTAGFA